MCHHHLSSHASHTTSSAWLLNNFSILWWVVGGEIRPAKQGEEEARASLAPLRHNCTYQAEDRREQTKERSLHKSVSLSEPSVWSLTLSLSLYSVLWCRALSRERERTEWRVSSSARLTYHSLQSVSNQVTSTSSSPLPRTGGRGGVHHSRVVGHTPALPQ